MTLSTDYHFDDFTTARYRRLLELARARYAFEPFGTGVDEPHVLWRHDVDYSLHRARALATIEAEQECRSTYFFLLHSDCYSLLEHTTLRRARELCSFGHYLGLHFDTAFYPDALMHRDRLEQYIRKEAAMLADLLEVEVVALSFHNPELSGAIHLTEDQYCNLPNAYGRSISNRYHYVSDSNGYWRHDRLEDVLVDGEHARLHVLTHPEWWQEEAMSPFARIRRCVEGRANAAIRRYSEELHAAGRLNVGAP